jgi:acid phosphatase class B
MRKAIIVDIDGTVATGVDRGPFDWDKVDTDLPKSNIIDIIKCMWQDGYEIIFVTGRSESCVDKTYEWLRLHCPPFVKLYMRRNKDFRKDAVVKREIYELHIKDNYNVVAVFDDRQQVVDMWREIGLTCLQVDYGNF